MYVRVCNLRREHETLLFLYYEYKYTYKLMISIYNGQQYLVDVYASNNNTVLSLAYKEHQHTIEGTNCMLQSLRISPVFMGVGGGGVIVGSRAGIPDCPPRRPCQHAYITACLSFVGLRNLRPFHRRIIHHGLSFVCVCACVCSACVCTVIPR